MNDAQSVVTLIGTRLAKEGTIFKYQGYSNECDSCKLQRSCLNLDNEAIYKIVNVRKTSQHPCNLHDLGVRAVDVVKSPIMATVESRKAFKGSKIIFREQSCDIEECEFYDLCCPSGIEDGEKYIIKNVLKFIKNHCAKNYSLKTVELRK